jgi:hypothetical protein
MRLHAIALLDAIFMVSTQIVINVVADFSQQLLIVFHAAIVKYQAIDMLGAICGHGVIGVSGALGFAVHWRCEFLK